MKYIIAFLSIVALISAVVGTLWYKDSKKIKKFRKSLEKGTIVEVYLKNFEVAEIISGPYGDAEFSYKVKLYMTGQTIFVPLKKIYPLGK